MMPTLSCKVLYHTILSRLKKINHVRSTSLSCRLLPNYCIVHLINVPATIKIKSTEVQTLAALRMRGTAN